MSIVWHKFPDTKPPKMGKYLVYSSDDYRPGMMIKTRLWGGFGWEYGDKYITHWAEYPDTPEDSNASKN